MSTSSSRRHPGTKSNQGLAKQFRAELATAEEMAGGRHGWAILKHRINSAKITMAYRLMPLLQI